MKEELLLEGRNPRAMPLSKIIKSSLSPNPDIKAFDLKDMLAEAKAKEEYLLKQAEAKQKVYDEGKSCGFLAGSEKGFSEGYAKGFDEGECSGRKIKETDIAEYDKTMRLLLQLVSNLEQLTREIKASAEKDVLTISIAVARQIIQKEISENPEILLRFVTEGLKKLGPTETAFIRIHPDDFELLSRKSQDFLQAVEGVHCLKFEQDPSLLRYDAIVESMEQSIDTRSNTQIMLIERRLLTKADEGKVV